MKLKTTLIALLLMSSSLWGQTITTNTNNLTPAWSSLFNSFQGQPSVSSAFRVVASNLTTNITVALADSTNWQVSTNNSAFTNTVLMASNSSNALLWVRMTGSNLGTFTNTVSLSSAGAATNSTTITGTTAPSLAALMYDRFSGNVVYSNTNTLTFTNSINASLTDNFSSWYDANDLLAGAQDVGANPLVSGNGAGHVVGAVLVTVSNINTKFSMPVDYRMSGEVKVVSYWTDRSLTNGGTNGAIAVWTLPFVAEPTNNTTTNGIVNGTQIKNTFTANYGGSGNARFYVVEQTLNFATVTNISATNPMQLKWIELQRRGGDAADTSSDSIYLSGVHVYIQ